MSIDSSQENNALSQSPLRSSVEASIVRYFVFLTDSSENVKTSNPSMRLKSTAEGESSISHKVLTLAVSNRITVKKYVCRVEEGATDRVCSKKDATVAAPIAVMVIVPAARETGCLSSGVVATNTRKMKCKIINKPRLVCTRGIS
jgi:hypothetical protein